MFDEMRKPFFVIALILMFLVVLVELGSLAVLGAASSAYGMSPTGKAIPALAFLDGIILFHTILIAGPLIIPERVQIKFQGIATLVFTVLLLLGCIKVIIIDIVLLILMVSLLFAPIFGTIAYFATWSGFDTSGAAITLSMVMTLQLIFCVCLLLAQQGFLREKGYMLIIATALICNLLIGFLHGIVPGVLVSITDDIAAIIVCVLAIIWAIVYLISGIRSVFRVATQTASDVV